MRVPSSLYKAWDRCLEIIGVGRRFTVHGMRYTFTDLVRLADVDAVVRRELTGHVTEEMQRHYSRVGIDEKRAALAGVLRLVPPSSGDQSGDRGRDMARAGLQSDRECEKNSSAIHEGRGAGHGPAEMALANRDRGGPNVLIRRPVGESGDRSGDAGYFAARSAGIAT